ncbi:MAG: uroporphyrinogen-III synthase [Thermoanaerobaculia bacterium]|nr:uroporphyrinogen-III synthase [Thermoanaerobaculia bacterium]
MTKSVFISRDLEESSEFATRLCAEGWQVRGFSLVTLTPLIIKEIPEVEWIFFASKNAVRFFFEGLGWKTGDDPSAGLANPTPDPSPEGEGRRGADMHDVTVHATSPLPFRGGDGGGALWAALGPATARELLRYTHRVDFAGTGDPDGTATAFLSLARGKRVLFPAARHSQQSIARILGDAITTVHLAVYDNAPLSDPPLLDESILVFTSPMNARAYFSRHSLQMHQRVVAIGQTTASALRALGIKNAVMSKEPAEAALADTVLAMAGK